MGSSSSTNTKKNRLLNDECQNYLEFSDDQFSCSDCKNVPNSISVQKYLNGNERKLALRRKYLGDEGLKLISQIIFKRLRDLDVSQNHIRNIEPLNKMHLPHLEYINLSENHIKDIKPLAELNCKKLKEICIQNNNINNFCAFLQSDFPSLERLRIENNKFNKNSDDFKIFLKKYKKQVIFTVKTKEEFNKKFGAQLDIESKKIILRDLREGDELLLELYLVLNPDINLIEINLQNNKIRDASIICRFPIRKLQSLDLSLNKISNINFLLEMEPNRLKYLFLNDNKINDISPLLKINYGKDVQNEQNEENCEKINFPYLVAISLENNDAYNNGEDIELLKIILNNHNIALG